MSPAAALQRVQALLTPAAALPLAFLLMAFALGGASRGNIVQEAAVQLASIVCLAWLALDKSVQPLSTEARPVLGLFGAYVVLAIVQLVPLPPAVWASLPGREEAAAGFAAIGAAPPWLPLSLAPSETAGAAFQALPALAAFLLPLKLRWRALTAPLLWALPCAAVASAALGVLQAIGGQESNLYFYEVTNFGAPVGVFANVNHQATFLLMALPFAAAAARAQRMREEEGATGKVALAIGLCLALTLGVLATGSVAGYALLAPVMLACALMSLGSRRERPQPLRGYVFAGALAVFALLVGLAPMLLSGYSLENGAFDRPELARGALAAIGETKLVGSGLGTFERLFPLFEDPTAVPRAFANHVHNDYLEWILETGLVGGVLLIAALFVFGRRAIAIWSAPPTEDGQVRRAATVALSVLLLHSFVDYPARTSAILALAGLCLGVMWAGRRRSAGPNAAARARHVRI